MRVMEACPYYGGVGKERLDCIGGGKYIVRILVRQWERVSRISAPPLPLPGRKPTRELKIR